MKYKGKELDVFKSDENIAFNPPRQMLVWDWGSTEPLVEYVAAFCPSRVNAVIINDGGINQYCAEIPKPQTNWDIFQQRYGTEKIDVNDAITEFIYSHMRCDFCPAKQQCSNLHTGNLKACVDTFKSWAEMEADEEK